MLQAAGIHAPEMVDGIKQKPIEGTSFAYTFDKANAKMPSHHKTQYFEMMGQWAFYQDGWVLSTKVNRAPWEAFGPANPDPSTGIVPVLAVKVSPQSIQLAIGETRQLSAAVRPTNATDQAVAWESTDSTVAAVDSVGRVTAKAVGAGIIITAYTQDGHHQSSANVSVNP